MISLVAALLYLPALGFDFVYDDHYQVLTNRSVLSGDRSIGSVLKLFLEATFPGDLYRPITVISYRLNYLVTGLSANAFHLINIMLHAAISALVYIVVRPFTSRLCTALIAAIWFAILPIHVEAVAKIVGRAELLATLFGIASLLTFPHFTTKHLVLRLAVSTTLFTAAVLSKESALSFLALIPLYGILLNKRTGDLRPLKSICLLTIPLLLCAGLAIAARLMILGEHWLPLTNPDVFYSENPLLQEPFIRRLWPALVHLGYYMTLMLVPLKLSADYSMGHAEYWSFVFSPMAYCMSGILVLFIAIALRFRNSAHVYFAAWIPISFALTINVLTPIGTIMADRLAYLPSVGFCAFCTLAIERLWSESNIRRATLLLSATAILGFHLYQSYMRLPVWQNNHVLFSQTVIDNASSPKAAINYGTHLLYTTKDYKLAEQQIARAIELDSTRIEYYKHMVNVHLAQNDMQQASQWIAQALTHWPKSKQFLEMQQKLRTL